MARAAEQNPPGRWQPEHRVDNRRPIVTGACRFWWTRAKLWPRLVRVAREWPGPARIVDTHR
jgi:hypothetical protein